MKYYDRLIFELSKKGRRGYSLKSEDFGDYSIPADIRRAEDAELPECDEPTVVRHYTRMSNNNFGVDSGFYPLGSCTMKYNPAINEQAVEASGINDIHPLQSEESTEGLHKLIDKAESTLCTLTGMDAFTFTPCAGAHGELTGLLTIRQYFEAKGDTKRIKAIIPDSAHGTNPASAATCGLEVVEVKSLPNGTVDVDHLKTLLDDSVAVMMMTNPNTLGIFESRIPEITKLVHECGAMMYYDGANFNAVMGKCKPGEMGFDVMHLNLHKSFATPHGGGGPGSGPVGAKGELAQYLPNIDTAMKVSGNGGNLGVVVKAAAYMLSCGEAITHVGELATLNANYVKESLKDVYELPIEGLCKHEFVFDGLKDKSTGVTTLDVAKRLLDYGFHAPTIYFPSLFHESLMIEPTETESKETLDEFIAIMRTIAQEAKDDPEMVKTAPHTTPIGRVDDVLAAKHPVLKYGDE